MDKIIELFATLTWFNLFLIVIAIAIAIKIVREIFTDK